MEIKTILINLDNISDYVPVLSTVTNLVDLFEKAFIVPNVKEIKSNHYWTHIEDKSNIRCAFLLIPVIGNLLVGLYDLIIVQAIKTRTDYVNDPKAMLEEYRKDNTVYLKFGPKLKDNKDFLLSVMDISKTHINKPFGAATNLVSIPLIEIASERLLKDRDFMLEAAKKDKWLLQYAHSDLKKDLEFMKEAQKIDTTYI